MAEWVEVWGMLFNVNKCKAMHMSRAFHYKDRYTFINLNYQYMRPPLGSAAGTDTFVNLY
jgi:hypothetical protein